MLLKTKIPPLLLVFLWGGLMWGGASLNFLPSFSVPYAEVLALLCMMSGGVVVTLGAFLFKKIGTTVNPTIPQNSSSLVTSGIYRYSRNPMYLGFFVILLGWAVYLESILAFVMLPFFILYMNYFQIIPEEIALYKNFGKEFLEYQQRVRRWL